MQTIGIVENNYTHQKKLLEKISAHINFVTAQVAEMIDARKKCNSINNNRTKAIDYCKVKEKYFDPIRNNVDELELLITDSDWPLPKYREMLFLR